MSAQADLGRLLREASEAELYELLAGNLDDLDAGAIGQALRNPYASPRVLELVAGRRALLRSYEVRRAVVSHPCTPPPRALDLLASLYWKDLVQLGADTRVAPRLRKAADYRLAQRLPALALGERMAIARGAGPGLIERLRGDPEPRVVGALLENPRLTEPMLAPLVANPVAPPRVLRLIAEDRRWGTRYSTLLALCLNPATPADLAISKLPALRKPDRRAVARDIRVADKVRRRAALLAGIG